MSVLLFIAAWVLCGLAAYGFTYAHFQREYPTIAHFHRKADRQLAATIALGGPAGLLTVILAGGFKHGWKL